MLLFGGGADAAYRRAARYGHGWTLGGGAPEYLGEGIEKTRAAWSEAGRDGEPGSPPCATSPWATERARRPTPSLSRYYAWFGEERAR